jgi:hypothetical protein
MAGRHVASAHEREDPGEYPAGIPNGGSTGHGRREHLVGPGSRISDDTSVTVDMEAMHSHPDVQPSPARPDELVRQGQVGDGTELE